MADQIPSPPFHSSKDITDTAAVEAALAAKSYKYVWVETPSNPLLNITIIERVLQGGRSEGIVDYHLGAVLMGHFGGD